MKKILFLASAMVVAASCAQKAPQLDLMDSAAFLGEVDGCPTALYTLSNGGITMQVTNFGARVVTLFTPDKNGEMEDIVVGRRTLDDYLHPVKERFFGACVGPVANRIGNASFKVDGVEYNTPVNDNGKNTLHGGVLGLDNVVWDVQSVCDTAMVLHYLHRDGQEGYPGNLDITMTYSLTPDAAFRVDYVATTDVKTPVNISNHPFFCLRGEGRGSVEEYQMQINASHYVPIDSLSIPTGEIAPVEGTPFDFRRIHSIGQAIGRKNEQLLNANGYDHNWCIDNPHGGVVRACTVYDPQTRRQIDVYTDQPGLQFYSGNFFTGVPEGKSGRPLGFRSSLALETQKYPDSPNHDNFPSVMLEPGDAYTHCCIYKFSVHTPNVDSGFQTR